MNLKGAAVIASVVFALVLNTAAQRVRPADRPAVKPAPAVGAKQTEITETDWKSLTDALEAENWTKSSELAARHLSALTTDNERKQLARLRYFQLFSFAGEILARNARGDAAGADEVWLRLDQSVASFIGKEFLLPPRAFAADCSKKLNYICLVRGTPNALRTTATNLEGNGIHSFDYVRLSGVIPEFSETDAKYFVGGILERAEYNDDPAKPWVLRLFFKDGTVRQADR